MLVGINTPIVIDIKDLTTDSDVAGIKKSESLMTISTVESFDDLSFENLEDLIDELISGKKSLKDLPENFGKYETEIGSLPKVPRKPGEFECCGSGCEPCVWDTYNRDLERRQRAMEDLCEKITDEGNSPL